MRVTEIVAGSPAARAGLQPGDRIVAAQGRPIRGRLDWTAVQTNLRTNVPLQLGVRRGQMNVDGVLVLHRAAASFWTSSAGATVLLARFTQLVTLAVALLVVFKRPGDRGARLASWLMATLDAGSPLVGLLRALQRPVQVGTGGSILKQLPETDSTWLAENHVDLIVPVATGAGGAESLFALGPKRSEEPYGAEDEDLLAAIGAALSLILRRAEVTDGAVVGGRYRLERPVGEGGMGTVYVAYDTALDRRVAVKVLRQDLIDPDTAERFQREARLAAALAHPNVVTVHDIGVTPSGHAFLVMELLEGVTLRQELRRLTSLPVPRVRDILRGVCAAVDAAHRRQMVHRDLKPENVFLCRGESGEIPKVLDFGLAKALGPDGVATLTRPGMVAGTPQYMAPEHLQGDEPSPDWDLWSLAVVVFEMITGRFPFDGPNATAPRLDELPEQLRPVFATALSRNPINRPASAQELLVLLEKAGMNDGPPI